MKLLDRDIFWHTLSWVLFAIAGVVGIGVGTWITSGTPFVFAW